MARRIKKYISEENIHQQVANYLRMQYPGILFRTDFAAGLKMTMGQAVKHKTLQAGRAWPDLFIAAPMYRNQKQDFYGLFIELKKDGTKLKRDKDAKKPLKGENFIRQAGDWFNQHIEEQAAVLQLLGMQGYCVSFAIGFDDAKGLIDKYLAGHPTAKKSIGLELGQKDEEVF